jgi:hypothetical protein
VPKYALPAATKTPKGKTERKERLAMRPTKSFLKKNVKN